MKDRSLTASHSVDYPYMKTRAGALQLPKMPWDYNKEAKAYYAAGVISTTIGLIAKFITK